MADKKSVMPTTRDVGASGPAPVPAKPVLKPLDHAADKAGQALVGGGMYAIGKGLSRFADLATNGSGGKVRLAAGIVAAGAAAGLKTLGSLTAIYNGTQAAAAVGAHASGVTDLNAPVGAYLNDQAKATVEAAPAAKAPRASQPTGGGSGPIEVPGYTRADGTQVKSYTRNRN